MHRTKQAPSPLETFTAGYGGRVVQPTDAEYPVDRRGWNLAADQRPVAIVTPTDAAEVGRVVEAAGAAGLRVAPQATGHNAGALTSLQDAVLLRSSALQEISIDPESRTATVGAGVVWEQVVAAAARYGLTALHGSSPNVGVVGYLLGGGLSWYSRRYGLANNHVRSVEVVLADGSVVTADRHHHRELFWALRGGGGSFGVVTRVEIDLLPVPTAFAGAMIWPQSRAAEVLRTWRDLTATLPEEITTTFRLMNFPPLPDLPDVLRGRRVVIVDGVAIGDMAAAAPLLHPLRELQPELDTFATVPALDVVRVHMDPEDPVPVVSDSAVLTELSDAALDELVAVAGPDAEPRLLSVELRHLGGAISLPVHDGGVVSTLVGEFLLFAGTVATTPEMGAAGAEAAREVVELLSKFGTERPYLNFVEHSSVDVRRGFDASLWRQLVGIKSAYDPHELFLGSHPVPTLFTDGRPTT